MNTTTNTYKATQEMMDSYDDNYVAYLGANPFSMLVIISDGEHRDTYRRNKVRRLIFYSIITVKRDAWPS